MPSDVYIGIGSNLGDRLENCKKAVSLISKLSKTNVLAKSKWIESKSLEEGQPDYINGVVKISTELSPSDLLTQLKKIETLLGRPKNHPKWSSRIIDLDIILYGNLIVDTETLKIPHPEMSKRMFVLKPLCDIWGADMKFFIDTADINEIKAANAMGLVDGVTTNPSLVAKTGRDFKSVIKDIIAEVDGPISLEVTALDADGMVKEARTLAEYSKNVVIKVPLTTEGLVATKRLTKEKIKTNVTLCFSPAQALLAAKAGATYISPFVGRLDDISEVGMELIEQIRTIYDNYGFTTQILVASIRNPIHVRDAALIGADVATIPFNVIKQLAKHPLTDIGIEKFMKDWDKVPK